eukprot:2976432-Pyramimonas_sp.AAC.1
MKASATHRSCQTRQCRRCWATALRRTRAIVDCFNGFLYFIGPGDHQLLPPPGSQKFQLELSQSGHWMLSVTEFEDQNPGHGSAGSGLHLLHSAIA